ncbi:MAG: STAS domain-containing protein [Alphaproteobacteria bacterium]|nr:STAS domain-containing protein [Alphaproteobacteria bacterium]OJV13688.1 MAG: hypothetical protein BGO27_00755 [Alphaproteobacteria bacterium 33-17]
MEYKKIIKDSSCTIEVSGKFTFNDHMEFKTILSLLKSENIKTLELNLSNLEFVDSAALGILLILKDEAEKHSIELILRSPKGQVQKMFEISKFYMLFNIID